ncbi:hypothetical protein AB8Z38_30540 [Bradyrhizobium sp. LLZ17]|uniref:Uncharacterized protein n=1 Tax=Bradyrhizobium sp. LLZ17 TaxID=3239388 RepID=A0AB39XJI6_9BRAD
MEAIVKIAAEKGRAVRVKHTSATGETLEVEMTGETAIWIREEALSRSAAPSEDIQADRSPRALGARSDENIKRLLRAGEEDVHKAIEQLYSPTAADLSLSEAQAVIDVVVAVLQAADLDYVLPQIATDLFNKGLFTLASALTEKLHRSHRNQEPPLTST